MAAGGRRQLGRELRRLPVEGRQVDHLEAGDPLAPLALVDLEILRPQPPNRLAAGDHVDRDFDLDHLGDLAEALGLRLGGRGKRQPRHGEP